MGKAEDRVAKHMAQEAKDREELHKKFAKEVGDKLAGLVPAFVKNIETLDYPDTSLSIIFDRRLIMLDGAERVSWRLVRGWDTIKSLDILADGTLVYEDYPRFKVVQPMEVWDLYRSYRADREAPSHLERMATFRMPRTEW